MLLLLSWLNGLITLFIEDGVNGLNPQLSAVNQRQRHQWDGANVIRSVKSGLQPKLY